MREKFCAFLEKYGQSITVTNGQEGFEGKAFIQPVRYKNKQYLDHTVSSAGLNELSNYLYIGKPEYEIGNMSNALINSCGKCFYVINSDMVFVGDAPLYEWAILRVYHEEDG